METFKKHRVLFIFLTITIDMIGIGILVPSMPDIMRRFLSSESDISNYFGYFVSIYALMQFVAAPFLGALSDAIGRRPVLIFSQLVAAFDYLLMGFAPNLFILFLGRVLSGLSGANVTVAMAYISDVSTKENRAANYGLMGAAFGLGFIIGPAIGGIIGSYGTIYPFIVAATLNLLNVLYGLFVLPESIPVSDRRKLDFSKSNPFTGLKKILSSGTLLPLLIMYFCFQLAGQTHPSIWVLYTRHKFNWDSVQIGYSLAAVGLLSAFSQGFLTRILTPKIGETKTVFIGSIGQIFTFLAFALAPAGWMIYGILIFSAAFWTAGPALQSLISQTTPSNQQGELQGSLVSLTSIACILNPILTTHLFGFFSRFESVIYFPGAPYAFASIVMLIASITFYFFNRKQKRSEA